MEISQIFVEMKYHYDNEHFLNHLGYASPLLLIRQKIKQKSPHYGQPGSV